MKKRIVFLDFVRIFACFLVILVHSSENYYGLANPGEMAGPMSWLANETDRLWVSVYDGFSRMSVPLFIIVSAYLLVPMKEDTSMWEFYRRRFTRILPPMFIFMFLYSFLPLAWGGTTIEQATTDFYRIPLNFPSLAGHLWFMYPLISVYLFTPIISAWLRKATAREELFFIVLFAISTCMPYMCRVFGEIWGQCFWNEYHMLWYFAGYIGYVVTAHYIRTHLRWSRMRRLAVGAAMTAVGAAATILSFYIQAVPQTEIVTPELEIGWSFCTINVFVLTIGAFLLFSAISIKKEPSAVVELSRLSFTIYLMHIFWLGLWAKIFKFDMALPTVAAIPAMAIATFASCWVTAKILSYIPGARYLGIETAPKAAPKAEITPANT